MRPTSAASARRLVAARRLVEQRAVVALEHRIASRAPSRPGQPRDASAPSARPARGDVARVDAGADQRRLRRRPRRRAAHRGFERHPGGVEHRPARARFARPGSASCRVVRRVDALVAQLDDRRGGLLDRAAGDVDHRPAVVGEHPPREGDLALDRFVIDIGGLGRLVERRAAGCGGSGSAGRRGGQPDDQRMLEREQARRRRRLRPPAGCWRPCSRGWRDRSLVGVFEVRDTPASTMSASSQFSAADPVVVRDGELDRVDPREIGGVQRVLAAGPRLGLLAEQSPTARRSPDRAARPRAGRARGSAPPASRAVSLLTSV